jgi:hypothetical protein
MRGLRLRVRQVRGQAAEEIRLALRVSVPTEGTTTRETVFHWRAEPTAPRVGADSANSSQGKRSAQGA